MGIFESFKKNVLCDIVKPRIGSVLKVKLAIPGQHTGIYIGDDEIVEVANIGGVATVRIVSAEKFIEGNDLHSRTGVFIYVACKQDCEGNCIAMGSEDIAERARAAVAETSKYSLLFNNCHMFTEYCITGRKDNLAGVLWGVENALDTKFIRQGYERLGDMWRSTGESRGDNPGFVDDEDIWKFEDNRTAACNGNLEAQFKVAENYYWGDGVHSNMKEAVRWYKRAASGGHVEAMMKLGEMYYVGDDGIPEDDAEAKKWYQKAANAGNAEAKEKLKYLD